MNQNWSHLFNPTILARGQEYFDNKRVVELHFASDKEHFNALVAGSGYRRDYEVSGRYRDQGRVSELKCSCPWAAKGHRCKHMVAVLLRIDTEKQNTIQKSISEKIPIKDELQPEFIQECENANTDDNPLTIIKDQAFTRQDYLEAGRLHQQLSVASHDFETEADGTYLFKIQLANGFLHFDVTIKFNHRKIINFSIASLLHNFSDNALKIIALERFLHYFIHENPTEETNTTARIFLKHFTELQNHSQVNLRAQFESASYDYLPTLRFKLGQEGHLYIVQSLPALVDSVRQHRKIEMGKYFNRRVDIEDMDEASQKWFNLIEQVVESSDAAQIASNDFYGQTFKEIPINATIADQIDNLLQDGAQLYEKNRPLDYQVNKERLPLKVKFDSKNKKAKLEINYLVPVYELDHLLKGHKNYYYVDLGSWEKFSNINPDLLDRYNLRMGDELVFGPKTIQTLGRKVLPQMKQSGNFAVTGMKKLEDALPPAAEFVFELDFQNQIIICTPVVQYGEKQYRLQEKAQDSVTRELQKEAAVQGKVVELGFKQQSDHSFILPLENSDNVDLFFDQGINQLKTIGQVKATPSFKRLLGGVKSKFNVSLGIRLGEDTLELKVTGQELTAEDIQAILNAYQTKRYYVLLRNGQVRNVESPSIKELANVMDELGVSLKQFVRGKMAVPAYRAFYLEKMLEKRDNLKFTSNDQFKRLVADLQKAHLKTTSVPVTLQKTLRPYQVKGFEWLNTLISYNLGGLLADEMGLGKTIQTIAVLLKRKELTNKPNLIIAPASVIYNWQAEIKKFAPQLKTIVLGGDKNSRRQQLEHVTDQILITSYDSLKRDLELYEHLSFDLEIIDEAQNIKNAKAATAKAVKIIKARHRIALTGTPIENNLSELWSIFDYLMPGFLGKYNYFKDHYEKPIIKDHDAKKEKQLGSIIAPFVLRRLKKDVLKDLPDKNEQVVYAQMSGKQKQLYQAQAQKLVMQLHQQSNDQFKKQRLAVLAEITKLRELCCDPHLLFNNYRGKSAKLSVTLSLINNALADGHKVLLFSQFTSMLNIIKNELQKSEIDTFVITGATPKKKRQELIKRFNQSQKSAVFLISLKAGGTGINLTSADVVIHYDPWWNIAAENQATDRAHRIGQKHTVQIYKVVAKNTIEEKIVDLQDKKAKLAEEVLNGEKISSSKLDREQILSILQR